MLDKAKIISGRKVIQAYRTAHTNLYKNGWHKGVSEEHAPLLNVLTKAFKGLGFNTIQEFLNASNSLEDDWE